MVKLQIFIYSINYFVSLIDPKKNFIQVKQLCFEF
jgi:hypothetical protein